MRHRRIVSLYLPDFATDRLARAQPRDEARPLVTVTDSSGRLVLAAVNAAARTAGLAPGQSLADARALCPPLATVPHDIAGNARTLAALAAWCLRYTPWTAPDYLSVTGMGGDPGVWLDITGCAHLFATPAAPDGEAGLLDDLVDRLSRAGFAARAAAADTTGAAWAMARFGPARTAAVPPEEQRAALAPLPVAALRIPAVAVAGLGRLGLRRIGDLYALPRAGLEARFGAESLGDVLTRLDQALGLRPEPISRHNPRIGRPRPPWRARLPLAEPVWRTEDVARGLERLLATLCPRLERAGRGARRLELLLFRSDATLVRTAAGTSRPSHDPAHLARLFAERLSGLEMDTDAAGIELMILEASRTELIRPAQLALTRQPPSGAGALAAADIGPLVDRLAARLGAASVLRFDPAESHLPERAARRRPALASADGPDAFPSGQPPRPVRLLPRPEPVRVTASAGSAPACFRWRRATHDIAHAHGPERIAPEWWRAAGSDPAGGLPRDYYRVESRTGGRFWLFRAGENWFLHGLFA